MTNKGSTHNPNDHRIYCLVNAPDGSRKVYQRIVARSYPAACRKAYALYRTHGLSKGDIRKVQGDHVHDWYAQL